MESQLIKPRMITALFDDQTQARNAIDTLRQRGVSDDAFSVIGRDGSATDGDANLGDGTNNDDVKTGHVLRGILGGTALGAGLGVAALAIPGVGPLVAAGAIAASAVPTAMATGAVIGAGVAGLGEALHDRGVAAEDSDYYAQNIGETGVIVGVDPSEASLSAAEIDQVLMAAGGRRATGPLTGTSASGSAFGYDDATTTAPAAGSNATVDDATVGAETRERAI